MASYTGERGKSMSDDYDEDDDHDTIPCPHCRESIHEDAERCPYCEQYLSDEDAPAKPKPLWIVAAAVICLVLVLFWSFPTVILRLLGF